jgi:hypothetical protein
LHIRIRASTKRCHDFYRPLNRGNPDRRGLASLYVQSYLIARMPGVAIQRVAFQVGLSPSVDHSAFHGSKLNACLIGAPGFGGDLLVLRLGEHLWPLARVALLASRGRVVTLKPMTSVVLFATSGDGARNRTLETAEITFARAATRASFPLNRRGWKFE